MVIWFILGIILLIYGIDMISLKSRNTFFLIWIIMGIISFLIGINCKYNFINSIPLFIKFLLIIFLAIFLIIEFLIISKFDDKGIKNLDYVIVLGALVYEDRPSIVLQYRLDKAYQYLKENKNTKCIVSGGQGKNEKYSEAKIMSDYLIKKGIKKGRIILEDKSTTTKENLQYSSKYFDKNNETIGIVTNNFHLFRSTYIAKKLEFKNLYGIASKSRIKNLPNNLLREFFAVLKCLLNI